MDDQKDTIQKFLGGAFFQERNQGVKGFQDKIVALFKKDL